MARKAPARIRLEVLRFLQYHASLTCMQGRTGRKVPRSEHRSHSQIHDPGMPEAPRIRSEFLQRVQLLSLKARMEGVSCEQQSQTYWSQKRKIVWEMRWQVCRSSERNGTMKSERSLFNLTELIRIVPYEYPFSNAKFVHHCNV